MTVLPKHLALESIARKPALRRRPRARLAVVLCVVAAFSGLGGGFAWWAKGRGFVYALKRVVIPAPHVIPDARVALSMPADGSTGFATSGSIEASFNASAGQLDTASVTAASVILLRTFDQTVVESTASVVGGRTVRLTPNHVLEPLTNYTFYVTPAVRMTSGARTTPYQVSFTTAGPVDPEIAFEKVSLATASNIGVTCLAVGPDHRLYAGCDDGRILRFTIDAADGSLGSPTIIDSLQRAESGPRLLTGFCVDLASPPAAPAIWVAHGYYAFTDAPDFTGKITRMSGPELSCVEDVVIHLPRSARDHLNNQPAIGPDGALYFPQGSNSACGAPDRIWGNRPERLLDASILRLDLKRVTPGKPIDALTPDADGSYDPFASGAALTIYASGVRQAYDLVWADDGNLYAPTNGSAAGGNAPAPTPLNNIAVSEDDWLFRILPGRYYGHPNPQQGHFVLNGGNPTRGFDFAEIPDYPVGTAPDANWTRAAYVFGKHASADGIIQYRSQRFGGRLARKLLVCRYSMPSDITTVNLNPDQTITPYRKEIRGFTNLSNPLDLVEDPATGNLYVSEYGARRITLLRVDEK